MRFHIPGLPHTVTNKKYIHCAFTQKVYKLCEMLTKAGHEVYHYGCEGSNPECTEHIDVIEDEYRRQFYPDQWHDKQWDYNIKDECHLLFYKNAIKAIKERSGDRDFLLCMWGWGHEPIAKVVGKNMVVVEPGIGYKDVFSKFRVFESYTWMSYVYGCGSLDKNGNRKSQGDGSYYDCVIPNYFDPNDFDFTPDEKEDYFLYLGRIITRKGIDAAVATVREIGGHLKIAGMGKFDAPDSQAGEIIEHVGFADVDDRRKLLSKAKGLLMPTKYIEPFGGVAVEAMMSGTPVISTDWGAFTETVLHGITGYRCRTLDHFSWAARNIKNISPKACREWALSNFSMERVTLMYEEYFDMLSSLWSKEGWSRSKMSRKQLRWLEKDFPKQEAVSISSKNQDPIPEIKIITPQENEPEYNLDTDWYTKPKLPGISFLVRAKNEEGTIGMAIDSLKQLDFPHEINIVLNQCQDSTEEIIAQRKYNKQTINVYKYPFQLGKTGLENQCTPVNSVHSTIWMLNWMMMKGNLEYTFRWDADFIMTSQLALELKEIVEEQTCDMANISAIFSDTGKPNVEPYLWSNSLIPRYTRYSLWHTTQFGKEARNVQNLSGRVIHDSPLSEHKSYWNTDPWWENDDHEETEEMREKISEKYNFLKQQLGDDCTTKGRASCPKSEELARRVQRIVGADTSEIVLLKRYASFNG